MEMRFFAMRILLVLTLLAAAVMPLYSQDFKSDAERQVMARITVTTDLDMQRVARLGLDLMEYREGDELIFLTTRKQLDVLRNAGWNVRIDEQLTAELPISGNTETFMGGYRTVEETFAFLNQMATAYPRLAAGFYIRPKLGKDAESAQRLQSYRHKTYKSKYWAQQAKILFAGRHSRPRACAA